MRATTEQAETSGRRTFRVEAAVRLAAALSVRSLLVLASSGWLQSAVAQVQDAQAAGQATVANPGLRRGALGWSTDASITSQATLTNNSNYGQSGDRVGDLIVQLIPLLGFNREGSRARVGGSVSLDMLAYLDGTQVDRILPQANIAGSVEAVERLFFIDASLLANQQLLNPYQPRTAPSTNNLYTYYQTRLVPYLQGNLGTDIRWQLRSDNSYTWTTGTDDPLSNVYYGRQLAEVVSNPAPLGLTLRASGDRTRYAGQVQPDQTLKTALAIVDYAFNPQLRAGIRVGYEDTNYTLNQTSGSFYGFNASWRPSPTAGVSGFWENRFYGPSYQLDASYRQHRLASSLSMYRSVTTYSQVLFQIPPTGSVSGLLNSILTARFPDPTDRARQVQDLVTRQGLPESVPSGAFIYNQSPNVLTGGSANFGLLGVRNTLALNLFYLQTVQLPDARIPTTFLVFNDNQQYGATLTLSHRLTPTASVSGSLTTTETRGLGVSEGLTTRQGSAILQATWQLSIRSTLFIGTRYQKQSDPRAAPSGTDSSEAAIFTGINHRL